MPLAGQAKADYQREYMRGYMRRRCAGLNKGLNTEAQDVKTQVRPIKAHVLRPKQPAKPGLVRPPGLTDDQWTFMQLREQA